MLKANKKVKVPFSGYYQAIAKVCDCSSQYVKMVLNDNLGRYPDRNSELVTKIREKAKELDGFLNF